MYKIIILKATATSDWWLKQLSGTYVNYVNETDPVKMSAYVWNNFYKKNDVYNKEESDSKYALKKEPTILGSSTFNVNNTLKNPSLEIFSNSQTSKDFIIENSLPGERGYDIIFNPRFNGNVKIGYNPYFDLGPGTTKDTIIPSSKLAVKGDINASENLIGKGLKVSSFDDIKAGNENKTLSQYIQEKSPTPDLTSYVLKDSNVYFNEVDAFVSKLYNLQVEGGIGGKLLDGITLGNTVLKKDSLVVDGNVRSKELIVSDFNNVKSAENKTLSQYIQEKSPTPDLTSYATKSNPSLTGKITLGNWIIQEENNKLCFSNSNNNTMSKKCFGDETLLTFSKNQPARTINYDTNWKLNVVPPSENIMTFENNANINQGDANLVVYIWLNLTNVSFQSVIINTKSYRGRIVIDEVPGFNSKEIIKNIYPAKNYIETENYSPTISISQFSNPNISKVILITVSKSIDYYWFNLNSINVT
jgi:hypothetical protein